MRNMVTNSQAVLKALDDVEKDGKNNLLPIIEKKISRIKNSLKFYPVQIKECCNLLSKEDVIQDYVLDAVNKIKKKQSNDELELEQLIRTFKQIKDCQNSRIKFSSFSRMIRSLSSKNISLEKRERFLNILILLCKQVLVVIFLKY
jgi:hypothetical protein